LRSLERPLEQFVARSLRSLLLLVWFAPGLISLWAAGAQEALNIATIVSNPAKLIERWK
jgi:hypothetical protein